jgi:hypothetical protein
MAAGRVVGLGLASGAAFGVYMGLITETLWIGAACGAGYAVLGTLGMWRSWGAKALTGLTFDQRQHVLRTLRQGQAVDDPQLLSAHWQHGNAILARPHSPALAYTGFGIVAVLLGAVAVMDFLDEGPGSLVSNMPLALPPLVMIFVGVPWGTRYREQVARSLQATAARMNQPS